MAAPGRSQAADRSARAWAWALGVSLAAHVAVLLGVLLVRVPALELPVTPRAVAASAPSFIKVGVLGHAASRADSPATAGPAAAGPPRRAAAPAAIEPRGERQEVAAELPAAAEASSAIDSSAVSSPTGAPSAGDEGTSPGGGAEDRGEGAGPAAGREGEGEGTSAPQGRALRADVVGLVHARLAANADRCYPAAARRFQQRGTVDVRFCVDAQGGVRDEQVQRSSGAGVLDAAVGTCVLPVAAPFPEEARGQCFTVPVRFGAR